MGQVDSLDQVYKVAQVQEVEVVVQDQVNRILEDNQGLVLVDQARAEEDLDRVAWVVLDPVDIQAWEEVDLALEDIQVGPDQVVIQLQQVQEVDHQHKDKDQILKTVLEIYLEVVTHLKVHLVARDDRIWKFTDQIFEIIQWFSTYDVHEKNFQC